MDYRRINNEGSIYSPEFEESVKGFIDVSDISSLKDNTTTGEVLMGMEYRPDLVAAYYLGNPKYDWMISYVNGFENGIEDYYSGRELIIPVLS